MSFVQLGKSGLFLPEHSSGAIVSLLFLLFICMDVTSRRREKKGVCVRGREREVGEIAHARVLRKGKNWPAQSDACAWQPLPEMCVHDRPSQTQGGRGSFSRTYYEFQNV